MSDEPTRLLLREVFPDSDVADAGYLRWLYRDAPNGPVVETNVDDDAGRAAHYALVPCRFATPKGEIGVALSLNTAVAERARGGGVFTRLAEATIDQARERGMVAVVGVANANSTPGFLRRLGFTLLGPLPATVLVPRPGRGARIASATADGVGIAGDPAIGALLADAPQTRRGVEPVWTPETLAWRLRSPRRTYAVHRGDGLLAVSTVERRSGVNVGVILAVLADHDVARDEADALVRAVCRHHSAPLALHVGRHAGLELSGIPLPARLRPSPLNLIFRWLDDEQRAAPHVGRFELLDFDAY
ncbi:GNAT family N-acetyltransferase [Patulibacter americanus]|uniref:GNAT family N-acetyltransferase n=1 Tax=Patulibacter americanus TaxID=588672 RepID=UPI0003B6E41D|nr:GNAT family N-acetyltransferase [Patulibacter americanus]